MGEAYLHNHGGMSFGKITATLPVNQFIVGDSANNGTAVIYAHFGRDAVRLHPSECVFSPATVSAGTTSITISATINGVTRSCSLPVTVYNPSSTFGSNTWETIAAVARMGRHREYWNVGDKKQETIRGTLHTFRILGFDHNDLNENDEMYGNPSYNKGKGKAAIALQFDTPAGKGPLHHEITNIRWSQMDMRTTTLPALLADFPAAMRNAVRLVDVWENNGTTGSGSWKVVYNAPDRIYLLSVWEAQECLTWNYKPSREIGESVKSTLYELFDLTILFDPFSTARYGYYHEGDCPMEWMRSCCIYADHDPSKNYALTPKQTADRNINADFADNNQVALTANVAYCPVFNI